MLFRRGLLAQTAIDPEADRTEQEIRHPHHEVNTLIVSPRFAEWVVFFLRTGGFNGGLSGRASVNRARNGQEDDEKEDSK